MTLQNRKILNTWIDQLAQVTGIAPLPLDEQGVTGIAFENGTKIIIGTFGTENVAHLSAQVLKAPDLPWQMYQAMRHVLACNAGFMGQTPCGIGLSPDQQDFILHQRLELDGMEIEDFGELLVNFSTIAARTKAQLKNGFEGGERLW